MTAIEQRPGRASHAAGIAVAGFDRVLWQRVEVDAHGPVGAVVSGTRRRRPVSARVDSHTAMVLLDAGVATVTRRVGSGS